MSIGDIDLLHTMNVLAEENVDPFLNLMNENVCFDLSAQSGFRPKSIVLPRIKSDTIEVFERGVIKNVRNCRKLRSSTVE